MNDSQSLVLVRTTFVGPRDEGALAVNAVDLARLQKLVDHTPRRSACDAELLRKTRLPRNRMARLVDAFADTSAHLVEDALPLELVGAEFDHVHRLDSLGRPENPKEFISQPWVPIVMTMYVDVPCG
jgi:hypothetical protein